MIEAPHRFVRLLSRSAGRTGLLVQPNIPHSCVQTDLPAEKKNLKNPSLGALPSTAPKPSDQRFVGHLRTLRKAMLQSAPTMSFARISPKTASRGKVSDKTEEIQGVSKQ